MTSIGMRALLCAGLAFCTGGVHAQSYEFDLSALDPAAASLLAEDVLLRAPDADVDRLFKAVHAASRSDDDAQVLCPLFDPAADRSPAALQRAADGLRPETRQRFLDALATVALSGLQSPRQPYDAAAALQVLKSAGAKAMFLNDGFAEGMAAEGDDAESRRARCRSLRWLVEALDGAAPVERAAATRYLMLEGLARQRAQP